MDVPKLPRRPRPALHYEVRAMPHPANLWARRAQAKPHAGIKNQGDWLTKSVRKLDH